VKTLLIIAHQPSKNTQGLAQAIAEGSEKAAPHIEIILKSPFQTNASDVLSADAVILFTTENFGYMSGALKDLFDRTYYQLIDKTDALPYGLIIRAGSDGTGTQSSVEKIISGLKWKAIQNPLVCKGEFSDEFSNKCYTAGATIGALLDNDLI